jgi:hypothetical protein
MKSLTRAVLGTALCLFGCAPALSQIKISSAVASELAVARDAYQFLHGNPELGKQETKAHDYLTAKLKALGFTQFVTSPSLQSGDRRARYWPPRPHHRLEG